MPNLTILRSINRLRRRQTRCRQPAYFTHFGQLIYFTPKDLISRRLKKNAVARLDLFRAFYLTYLFLRSARKTAKTSRFRIAPNAVADRSILHILHNPPILRSPNGFAQSPKRAVPPLGLFHMLYLTCLFCVKGGGFASTPKRRRLPRRIPRVLLYLLILYSASRFRIATQKRRRPVRSISRILLNLLILRLTNRFRIVLPKLPAKRRRPPRYIPRVPPNLPILRSTNRFRVAEKRTRNVFRRDFRAHGDLAGQERNFAQQRKISKSPNAVRTRKLRRINKI